MVDDRPKQEQRARGGDDRGGTERPVPDRGQGDRPGVIPNGALYYHTTAVNPGWSNKFKRVATIGAHEFYASN